MMKKICIVLIIIYTSTISAMNDVPMSDVQPVQAVEQALTVDRASAPTDGICHLACLPVDGMNYIAQFLPFNNRETKEELIARTCEPKTVPHQYYEDLLTHIYAGPTMIPENNCDRNIKVAFCPQKTKFVFFENFHGMGFLKMTLTIFDLTTKTTIFTQKFDATIVRHLALSQCAQMFAFICNKIDDPSYYYVEEPHYENALFVKNIKTEKIQKFSIPKQSVNINSIAFNKQGTHLIVHGVDLNKITISHGVHDYDAYEDDRCHLIFPLESDAKIIEEKSEKKLDEYFRQNWICREIAKSK
jgi:hypothetical protein